jgi:hypothetical protein
MTDVGELRGTAYLHGNNKTFFGADPDPVACSLRALR